MINSILVDGYKCLKMNTPLAAGFLNVLLGANASGKSSFLQAMLLLRQSTDKNGIVSALHLSGPLYEAGTAQDALHPAANHLIRISIESDSEKTELIFEHDRDQDIQSPKRLLAAHESQKTPPLLHDRSTGFAYLNAERVGPRVTYALPPDDAHLGGAVGKHGEYTAAMLARSKNGIYIDGWDDTLAAFLSSGPEKLDRRATLEQLQDTQGRLDLVCNEMLSWIIPGAVFEASENDSTDAASLRFIRDPNTTKSSVRATHVGFGLAYTVPIIAACLALRTGGLLIVENPEAHLHPFSQSRIGAFLALMAATGRQIFVETHSDHVINGMRLAVSHNIVAAETVYINFFQRPLDGDRSEITQIRPRPNGKLDKWPSGFLDQIENDLSNL